jgi:glutaminase
MSAIVSPLEEALASLQHEARSLTAGEVATYIPELARADPAHFGIAVATLDGNMYAVGDTDVPFTIQSISKPFVYALALHDRGVSAVMETVGVEPSGEAFNAISLEPQTGRPRNPMINAGAIATAGLVSGDDTTHKMERTVERLSEFAGRRLALDEPVYRSERDTGHRNRAIAYLLRNAAILGEDVDDVLDRYFRQCSLLVTASDLAMMAATLANAGINPLTRRRVIEHDHVESVLSVMSTCGMYDYAGSWLYRVGMPAKSGVSGGIIAVLPGQLGIGVYSPALDEFGNSVRGVAVCEAFSREFGLHILRPPVHPGSVVAATYRLADVHSKRRRTEAEAACLAERGERVHILRLQGPLVLSTAEVALRTAIELAGDQSSAAVVFDCHRIPSINRPAWQLFQRFALALAACGGVAVVAGLREGESYEPTPAEYGEAPFRSFGTIDDALEWCEDALLEEAGVWRDGPLELTIERHPLLVEMTPHEQRALSSVLRRAEYRPGDNIVTQGDVADTVYFLVAGDVSVHLDLGARGRYRVATIGPGDVFGEFALLDHEPRTADIDAATDVVCYELRVADLLSISEAEPAIRLKFAEGLARNLASRLRRADTEIMALAT